MKEVASHTQGEYELVDVGGMSPKGDTDLSYQLVGREYICDLIFGTFRKEQKRELELAEANAEFIVRACNSHAELLAALEALVANHDYRRKPLPEGSIDAGDELFRQAEAAIQKAKP